MTNNLNHEDHDLLIRIDTTLTSIRDHLGRINGRLDRHDTVIDEYREWRGEIDQRVKEYDSKQAPPVSTWEKLKTHSNMITAAIVVTAFVIDRILR